MEEENFKNKEEEIIFPTHFMRPVLLWDLNQSKMSQVNKTVNVLYEHRQKKSKKILAKRIQ